MITIQHLFWDDFNREHIKKHNVSQSEAEQALNNAVVILEGHDDRYLVIGRTINNRLLTLVIDTHPPEGHYIVTARDTNQKERKLINRKETT